MGLKSIHIIRKFASIRIGYKKAPSITSGDRESLSAT